MRGKKLVALFTVICVLSMLFVVPVLAADGESSLKDGLVAHFPFDGNVKDVMNGTDGTINSSTGTMKYVDGPMGSAVIFDGSSYLEYENDDAYQLGLPYTISMWVYQDEIRPYNDNSALIGKLTVALEDWEDTRAYGVISTTSGSGNFHPMMHCIDGTMENPLWTDSEKSYLDMHRWQLVTITNDGTTMKFYLDGVLMDSKNLKTTVPPSTGSLLIGAPFLSWDEAYFKGCMDDLRLYNRVLKYEEVKQLYQMAAEGKNRDLVIKPARLVAHYTFDDNFKDISEYGNNGPVRAENITFVQGKIGKAAKFNGSNYLEIPDSSSLDIGPAFTFSAWLKPANTDMDFIPIISKLGSGIDPNYASYDFYLDNNDNASIKLWYPDQSERLWWGGKDNATVLSEKWQYVVATFDGVDKISIYVDGVLKETIKEKVYVPYGTGSLRIGWMDWNGGHFYEGLMDDLKIYNRELTYSEIKRIYDVNSQGKPVNAGVSGWAKDEVEAAEESMLTTDTVLDEGVLNITRVEFCELAVKLYESITSGEAVPASPNPFKDTDNISVLKAYKLGIVKGRDEKNGIFAPDANITRQELALMMLNALKAAKPGESFKEEKEPAFKDKGEVAVWAKDAVNFFSAADILKGSKDTSGKTLVQPKNNASRQEAILLINRTFEKFAE